MDYDILKSLCFGDGSMNNETCGKFVKRAGFKSTEELSEITKVPRSTLEDWYKKKKHLFKIIVIGASVMKNLRSVIKD